ncbi:MAG: hypothetical protein H7A20_03670 [Rhodanobacteraceae bacterium]|nr:hypothetical protein [Xanthomonadales bacterium]MCP5477880.1 hypothetical protein [Rhodanobacteraceae bacterium]HPF73725.1 hypothetical protein [Xanthomonadaceae bacterium]HRY00394.1 hypothetical protein [Xanthomonadaceae bacterium]
MAAWIRFSLAALLLFGLAACDQQGKDAKDTKASAEPAAVHPPADPTDKKGWNKFINYVAGQNMSRMRGRPTSFFLASSQEPEWEGRLDGMHESVGNSLARGILPRSLVIFASPETTAMADLMVEEFEATQAGTLRDVRILFIGAAEDEERVKAAVAPSGAEFVFHEAK